MNAIIMMDLIGLKPPGQWFKILTQQEFYYIFCMTNTVLLFVVNLDTSVLYNTQIYKD